MKALVKFKPGKDGIEVRDIPEPKPGKNEVKIKVSVGGICGTDIHIMQDEYPYKAPVVMGHEYTGIIDEVGAEVEGFKKGDHVVSLTAAVTCGHCKYCREGLLMLCDNRLSIGSGINGAFAEYLTVPSDLVFKVPEEVTSKDELAVCEPFACVVRGVIERSTVKAGDVVLVSGPGTIGLFAVQLVKLQGGFVIASGVPQDEERLRLAKKLGADVTVSNPDDLPKVVKSIAPLGVDVAFECSGVGASAKACLLNLRKQGIYSQVGLFGKEISIDMDKFLFKEIQITNSFASERTSWEIALRLIKNRQVNLSALISAKIPLDNWREAFDMVVNKKGYKVLLVP